MQTGKAEQRKWMRECLRGMAQETKALASQSIVEKLLKESPVVKDRTLLGFMPLGTEPDIASFLEEWQRQGGMLALPRMRPSSLELALHAVADFSHLQTNNLGVQEPNPAQCPLLHPEQLGIVLVPGLGFNKDGHRLGRGGSYYDRLLERIPAATLRIGCFFDCQELPSLEIEAHDQPLDRVITEKRTLHFKR